MQMSQTKQNIILELSEFCIETSAKKRMAELGNLILSENSEISENETEEFEFLRRFLNESNFARLRNNNPLLRGENHIKVSITEANNGFEIEILNDKPELWSKRNE